MQQVQEDPMAAKPGFSRRTGLLVGLPGAALTLAACGEGGAPAPSAGGDKKQEIEYWHGWSGDLMTGSEGMIPMVIRLFNQKYPNVTVNALSVPWNDIPAKLTTTVAAGTPPDVVMAANGSGVLYSY